MNDLSPSLLSRWGALVAGGTIAAALAILVVTRLAGAFGDPPTPASSQPQDSTVRTAPDTTAARRYSKSGYDITPWPRERVLEAAKSLSDEQRRILLDAGTEPAFCGVFTDNKEDGIYVCAVGGLPLFKSENKFISKSGWASFFAPFDPDHIIEKVDRSHGMVRVEILDARTGAHLGHVFDDGPAPTGKRYCLNSGALRFIKKGDPIPAESMPALETAYFAGGCFWGVEDAFAKVKGVIDVESGFSNGRFEKVTYKQVCNGDTGAAEVVKIVFDPKVVAYGDLVKQFFRIHDPTTPNRQGPDIGDQYRSAIFVTSPEQEKAAKEIIASLQKNAGFSKAFNGRPIVTQVAPIANYVRAEDYHQDYHAKNGGQCHVRGYQGDF
jgi:peptide methionine sulfoxide reductase msrA/msrB